MNNKSSTIKLDARYKEGPLFKVVALIVTTIIVVLPFAIFMLGFNRVRIFGRRNLHPKYLPFIFISNHVSMLDDMFIGPLLFTPRGIFNYRFMPYHTPEQSNFYKGPIISWIMEHLKCIPLQRGKGINQEGIQLIIKRLKEGGSVQIYPEGTRTRSGHLGKGKPGVGKIVYDTKCNVIPCYHSGLEKVLPIGKKIPSLFKKITVIIGEPFSYAEYFQQEDKVETWRNIADDMINRIRALREKAKEQGII